MSFYFECITGRLQFTMGAWGMADEAVPTYIGLIDSHTLGMRFLKQEFGECGVPRTAWQIDSFGHSREFAYLFAMVLRYLNRFWAQNIHKFNVGPLELIQEGFGEGTTPIKFNF